MPCYTTLTAAIATTLLVACPADEEGSLLVVDLKSDLVAGVEVHRVRTTVVAESGGLDRSAEIDVALGADFLSGFRIAELSGLAPATYEVRVELLEHDGTLVAARPVRVVIEGQTAMTVLMTRDCVDLTCPLPGQPDATSCLGGRCVDPGCIEERPELCGLPACTSSGDCTGGAACAEPVCIAGVCLLATDVSSCAAGQWCDPSVGCRDLPASVDGGDVDGGVDTGTPDAPATLPCTDGHLGSALGPNVASGTATGNDNTPLCADDDADDAAWGFIAPGDGVYRFVLESDGDGVIITVLDPADACVDNAMAPCTYSPLGGNTAINAELSTGQEVVCVVDGGGIRGVVGTYRLGVFLECPNQDIGSAVGADVATGTTAGARDGFSATTCMDGSREAGEVGEDVTVQWTAPSAGRYAVRVDAPTFDPHLYVLDGGCAGPELACAVGTANTVSATVDVTAGQSIIIAIDAGARASSGSFAMSIQRM